MTMPKDFRMPAELHCSPRRLGQRGGAIQLCSGSNGVEFISGHHCFLALGAGIRTRALAAALELIKLISSRAL
jgi:hypothetical protein